MIVVRRIILLVGVVGVLSLILFGQLTAVNAQSGDICADGSSAVDSAFCDGQTSDDVITGKDGMISKILQFLVFMVTVVSVFVLVIGGYRIGFSGGEAKPVEGGRNMIIYAVVGLVIAMAAQLIVSFVLNRVDEGAQSIDEVQQVENAPIDLDRLPQ